MAQLKDTVVSGSLRATDTIYTTTEQLQSLKIPDSSGSSTYTTGTAGQIMRTNGSTVYWATGNSAQTVIALGNGWSSSSPYTQTISVTGVTATNNIVVGLAASATATQYDAACSAKILCTAQGPGTITLTAYGDEPIDPTNNTPVDIPFTVIVTG